MEQEALIRYEQSKSSVMQFSSPRTRLHSGWTFTRSQHQCCSPLKQVCVQSSLSFLPLSDRRKSLCGLLLLNLQVLALCEMLFCPSQMQSSCYLICRKNKAFPTTVVFLIIFQFYSFFKPTVSVSGALNELSPERSFQEVHLPGQSKHRDQSCSEHSRESSISHRRFRRTK